MEEEEEERRWLQRDPSYLGADYEFSSSSGYPHNTYHGQTRHYRPSISFDGKPLRFTDSPQHLPYGVAQSPRRKSSNASTDSDHHPPCVGIEYSRPDNYHPYVEYYPGRTHEVYHYYSPQHDYNRQENYFADRMYSDYGRSDMYPERIYPEFVRHQDGHYAYENPTSSIGSSGPQWGTPSRLVSAGTNTSLFGHKRTPSNVSNTSNASSNVNPSFHYEDDEDVQGTPTHRLTDHVVTLNVSYPGSPAPPQPPPRSSRQNSQESGERPTTLDLPPKSRKLKYSTPGQVGRNSPKGWASTSSTPTNPTPPESMTSEDSSYVSARVRFSPTTPATIDDKTLLDLPAEGQSQDNTVPLTALRNLSLTDQKQNRKLSITEFEREFL